MSLYNRVITEGATPEVPEVNIVNESEWLGSAIVGLTQDIYKVMEASDIADIVGEHQVITEGAEVEAVLESIMKGGFDRLKAAFQKFWDKMKTFFNEVKKQIQLIFVRGEKFIKEFEKEIIAKTAKGYKYMGYKYNEAGLAKCTDVLETARAAASNIINKIEPIVGDSLKEANKKEFLDEAIVKAVGLKDDDKLEEGFIKSMNIGGATNASELSLELAKLCRGGEEKEELEDFEDAAKSEMIKIVKDKAKSLEAITKAETTFDSTMKAIIGKITELSTKKDASEDYYKAASAMSSMLTKILNVGKIGTQVSATIIKERAVAYETILKGYLRYKPVKESTVVPTTESATIFDSIYKTIC